MVLEYLPTFALKITKMWVNIPYMEHIGMFLQSNSWQCIDICATSKILNSGPAQRSNSQGGRCAHVSLFEAQLVVSY